jgi:hypothetical protein
VDGRVVGGFTVGADEAEAVVAGDAAGGAVGEAGTVGSDPDSDPDPE